MQQHMRKPRAGDAHVVDKHAREEADDTGGNGEQYGACSRTIRAGSVAGNDGQGAEREERRVGAVADGSTDGGGHGNGEAGMHGVPAGERHGFQPRQP
ncbi:hypothetical protein SG18_21235 [Pandoraea apista]|nr:hypothetical protein SG18_21235 [Pandoraea apista]AKH74234.1 hypothetical protein XM39_21420 [Pandoraea apista]AKI62783.1 hypothetical protein AA956_14735 [Pandoraea apista]